LLIKQYKTFIMNKADLIAAIAKGSKLTKADSEKALNATIESIKGAVKKGQRVGIIGFGAFSVIQRKARIGRNPQTGKEIKIAAKKVVKFKPGTGLAIK
jgi:DNA-binding protein HU-beta